MPKRHSSPVCVRCGITEAQHRQLLRERYLSDPATAAHADHVNGRMSATNLCMPCGEDLRAENAVQLAEKSGPAYDHWRRRCYLAAVKALMDGDDMAA